MINRFSIVTIVLFFFSAIFVIRSISFPIWLPYLGRRRVPLDLTTAPIIAIAILWAAQCIGATQIRNGIVGTDDIKPYNILILFITLAYMAITLDITGVLEAAAFWVSNKGGSNTRKLFFYFYVMLTLISLVLGNDPVILSGTAFLVYYTNAAGLKPLAWLMSEFAAANTSSMVLFVGNPTNVVICEGFLVNNVAFTAYTILPFLACSVSCFVALFVQFRDEQYLPRKIPQTEERNPLAALHDPIGAWVGSFILGSCLVVIIIVSFFKVDVWKISLPFAGVKFIFDLAWDHYRFTRNSRHANDQPYSTDSTSVGTPDNKTRPTSPAEPETKIDIPTSPISPAEPDHKPDDNRHTDDQSGSTDTTLVGTPDDKTPPTSPTEPETKISIANSHISPTEPGYKTDNKTTSTSPINPKTKIDIANSPTSLTEPGYKTDNKTTSISPINPEPRLFYPLQQYFKSTWDAFAKHFPTVATAIPRLPFALIPFAFSQFILIEGLSHQGWIEVFADWLVKATHGGQMHSTIWLIGVLGVLLCNIAGTNIGATILLTKVVRAAPNFPRNSVRAAAIALAVASNIGAVSFVFSASLAGLLWHNILQQKNTEQISQWRFARWNLLPLVIMTSCGLAIVSAEMALLYR